jgi:hypothetical protein
MMIKTNLRFYLLSFKSSKEIKFEANLPRPDEIKKLCEQKHTATSWKKRPKEALLRLKVGL